MSLESGMISRVIAGKYRVDELLGEGSMGAVYGATQLALGKSVALKVMRQELAQSEEFAERFQREAQAASRFTHPNSIQVTDFGVEPDGLLYLVMERAQGLSMDALLSSAGALEESRIARIMSQILSALAAAHDAGIVHRDLKPENVLIVEGKDDDGNPTDVVKVCDFGIASIRGVETISTSETTGTNKNARLTAVGAIVGTPAYMAPEQAQGGSFDARSDVYSAGIVLYELLTGRIPFDGESLLDVVAKHIHEAPKSPRVHNASISNAMANICLRAIAKSPADRYPNARAMKAEFKHWLSLPASVSITGVPSAGVPGDAAFGARSTPLVMSGALSDTVSTLSPRTNKVSRTSLIVAATLIPLTLGVVSLYAFGPRATGLTPPQVAQASSPSEQATPLLQARGSQDSPLQPSVPETSAALPMAPPSVVGSASAAVSPPKTLAARANGTQETVSLPAPSAVATTEHAAIPEPVASVAKTADPLPIPVGPSAAPVVEPPKPFTPDRGRVRASVSGASRISRSTVQAVVGRVNFDSCYQSAIRTLGHNETGAGSAHLDIDEDGLLRVASLSVPSALSGARACISSKLQGQRVTPPDTGNATADVSLTFEIP